MNLNVFDSGNSFKDIDFSAIKDKAFNFIKGDDGNSGFKNGSEKTVELVDEIDIPPAFKQTEFASTYEARLSQTPADTNSKVVFEAPRGESLCTLKPPPDTELEKILNDFGVEGIQYQNAVPVFHLFQWHNSK